MKYQSPDDVKFKSHRKSRRSPTNWNAYPSAGQKFMLILAVWESCGYCRDEATAAQAMRQVYVKSHGVISRFCGVVCFPTWSKFPDSAE